MKQIQEEKLHEFIDGSEFMQNAILHFTKAILHPDTNVDVDIEYFVEAIKRRITKFASKQDANYVLDTLEEMIQRYR